MLGVWKLRGQALAEVGYQTSLVLRHWRSGVLIAEWDLGPGLVTTAGVTRLAQDWNNVTACLKLANYHDFGNGNATPTIADTSLQSASIMRAARVVGAQSNPAGGTYETDGLMTFTGTDTIREWGLFLGPSGSTMWDRRTFTGIPVVVNDQVEARYSVAFPAGG